MRLLVESDFKPVGGIIGAGFDEFRWPLPVRPGDELHVESEVLGTAVEITAASRIGQGENDDQESERRGGAGFGRQSRRAAAPGLVAWAMLRSA